MKTDEPWHLPTQAEPQPNNSPNALWWFLLPIGLLLALGMDRSLVSNITIEMSKSLGHERFSTLMFWAFTTSTCLLYFPNYQGKSNGGWLRPFRKAPGRFVLLALLCGGWYAWNARRETYQHIRIMPKNIELLCTHQGHPKDKDRNITRIGGYISVGFKGGKEIIWKNVVCTECYSDDLVLIGDME